MNAPARTGQRLIPAVLPIQDSPSRASFSLIGALVLMPSRPWFPFNPGDFYRDTAHLTLEQQGAYIRLLSFAWDHDGTIPLDKRARAQILGVHTNKAETLWGFVSPFWFETHGGFRQKRIDRELSKSIEIVEKRQEAGRLGGLAKAKANAIANAVAVTTTTTKTKKEPPTVSPKKGRRWGDEERVPDDWIAWAVNVNGTGFKTATAEAEKFADYWRGAPGAKGVKVNWLATWRNWIRNCRTRSNGSTEAPAWK